MQEITHEITLPEIPCGFAFFINGACHGGRDSSENISSVHDILATCTSRRMSEDVNNSVASARLCFDDHRRAGVLLRTGEGVNQRRHEIARWYITRYRKDLSPVYGKIDHCNICFQVVTCAAHLLHGDSFNNLDDNLLEMAMGCWDSRYIAFTLSLVMTPPMSIAREQIVILFTLGCSFDSLDQANSIVSDTVCGLVAYIKSTKTEKISVLPWYMQTTSFWVSSNNIGHGRETPNGGGKQPV